MNHETLSKISAVREFIQTDELKKALTLMSSLMKNDTSKDELILQLARKYRLEKQVRQGIISYENASVTDNQIAVALLSICREIEDALKTQYPDPIHTTRQQTTAHQLQEFPAGPMVEGRLIDESIVQAFARTLRREQFLAAIHKANNLRLSAEVPPATATIIEDFDLLHPTNARPLDFWMDAFHEACLHGPRMLAALLLAVPDDQFPKEAREAREKLLIYLKSHS